MKAKLFLVLAATAMIFTACGKDKIYKNELTWNGDTREVMGSVSVEQQGTAYYITCHTPMEMKKAIPTIPSNVRQAKTASTKLLT